MIWMLLIGGWGEILIKHKSWLFFWNDLNCLCCVQRWCWQKIFMSLMDGKLYYNFLVKVRMSLTGSCKSLRGVRFWDNSNFPAAIPFNFIYQYERIYFRKHLLHNHPNHYLHIHMMNSACLPELEESNRIFHPTWGKLETTKSWYLSPVRL